MDQFLVIRSKAIFVFFPLFDIIGFFFGFEHKQEMEANVTVNCVHPGIVRTRLTREREGLATGGEII